MDTYLVIICKVTFDNKHYLTVSNPSVLKRQIVKESDFFIISLSKANKTNCMIL